MSKFRFHLALVLLAAAGLACEVEFVTPTIVPIESKTPTPLEVVEEIPTEVLAQPDESQQSPIGMIVSVTHGTVNLRNSSHASTGSFVQYGDVLAVKCGKDGYCEILEGSHVGLYIWRGCTSNPAGYGCEAK